MRGATIRVRDRGELRAALAGLDYLNPPPADTHPATFAGVRVVEDSRIPAGVYALCPERHGLKGARVGPIDRHAVHARLTARAFREALARADRLRPDLLAA